MRVATGLKEKGVKKKLLYIACAVGFFNIFFGSLAFGQEGDEEEITAAKLFGGGGGYIHPYITVAGMYDDNVFNDSENSVSDSAMVISPGIWLAVPNTREKLLNLETDNLTPGGLMMTPDRGRKFKRFQGYLHYGGDFTRYSDVEDNDTDDHRVEGYLQYNLKGNLNFEVLDIYLDDHNGWNNGISDALSTYKSNLFGARTTYTLNQFRVRLDYTNYLVDYDDEQNKERDRIDDKIATYLYYKLSPKSTIFAEYDYLDISYDNAQYLDSDEHHIYGGFRWKVTGKTLGEIKLGYQMKDFADDRLENAGDFIMQGWVDYDLSAKTRLKFLASRTIEEPNVYSLQSVAANNVSLLYTHFLTHKITGNIKGGYTSRDYGGVYRYDGNEGERDDDDYSIRLFFDYDIQDWLQVRASYDYFNRDSSFPGLSYTDNQFLISLSLRI